MLTIVYYVLCVDLCLCVSRYLCLSDCIFADLGCGGGKVIIATAALLSSTRCKQVIGIELISSLCQYAEQRKHQLQQLINTSTNGIIIPLNLPAIDIIHDDFLTNNIWHQANIIFMCSTLFTNDMMITLSKQCESTGIGTYIITVSQPLLLPINSTQPMFVLLSKTSMPMSWGMATVYIYQKQHNRRMEHVILRAFQKRGK